MEVFLASLPPGLGSWLVPGDLRAGPRLGVGVQRAGAGSEGGGGRRWGGGGGGRGGEVVWAIARDSAKGGSSIRSGSGLSEVLE